MLEFHAVPQLVQKAQFQTLAWYKCSFFFLNTVNMFHFSERFPKQKSPAAPLGATNICLHGNIDYVQPVDFPQQDNL